MAPFDPTAKYHLIIERPGEEVEFLSYTELPALCAKTEEVIGKARTDGLLPKIRVVEGLRCPVSAGPMPKVMIGGQWIALVQDPGVSIADCPADGAVLGQEEDVEEEPGLNQLDVEDAPEQDEETQTRALAVAAGTSPVGGEKTATIFGQD